MSFSSNVSTSFDLKPMIDINPDEAKTALNINTVEVEVSDIKRSMSSPPPPSSAREIETKHRDSHIHAATFSTSPHSQGGILKPPKRERSTFPGGHGQDVDTGRSPRQYQEYIPEGGMYVLYENDDDDSRTRGSSRGSAVISPEDDSLLTDRRPSSHRRTQDTNNTYIGEIDGRFSFSQGEDYVRVEINTDGSSTSHELLECKRTVLKPYLIFLKMIGWRRLREAALDLARNKLSLAFNVTYPLFIFLVLLATIITQNFTCYYRTQTAYFALNETQLLVNCTDHLVVDEVIPGLLILTAFLYGVYIFRYGEPEHLAALIETVFLSHSQVNVSKKGIIRVLRYFLVSGVLWIILDISLNILRLLSLQLLDDNTFIQALLIPMNRPLNSTSLHSVPENIIRYVCVLFSLVGFVFFDLLYFAVVVTYVSESQLIQYYISSIMEKVRAKTYSLEDAIKDIRQTYKYLEVINSKLATLTTLMMFIFIGNFLSSIYNLAQYPVMDSNSRTPIFYLGVVVGIGNILQWSLLSAAPIIQAARLTARCRQLRRLGLEIASRPFVYAGTPQLDLDFFLQYTNATRYTAKLASVPIYPSFVVGFLFIGTIVGSFIISVNNHFVFANWF
ncbi:uncharacterized protein LOC135341614 isoform X2 [Halichondria panicea]|uniref:uncharacterized protein LOC135341614 isoform X2 n=1 Tax=Halichondria panicea TaxID=6063 RepID=UPI00312BC750